MSLFRWYGDKDSLTLETSPLDFAIAQRNELARWLRTYESGRDKALEALQEHVEAVAELKLRLKDCDKWIAENGEQLFNQRGETK